SEEHTSELQSRRDLVCRLLLEKKKKNALGGDTVHPAPSAQQAIGRRLRPRPCLVVVDIVVLARHQLRGLEIDFFFFFNDPATTEIYTLSLHDALPILHGGQRIGLQRVDVELATLIVEQNCNGLEWNGLQWNGNRDGKRPCWGTGR